MGMYWGVILAIFVLGAILAALYGLGLGIRWLLLWVSNMAKKCPKHDQEMRVMFNTYECDVCEGRVTKEEVENQTIPPEHRLLHCISMAREGKHCEFACDDPLTVTNRLQDMGIQPIEASFDGYVLKFPQGRVVFRNLYGHERGERHKTAPVYVKRASQIIWLYYEE